MDFTEKTLSSQQIFRGKIINVKLDTVSLPDGRESKREIVEHGEAVAIAAVDDEKNILMVRQFRKPIEQLLLEIPAGLMEENENALETAKRELAEETGFRASEWEQLAYFYTAPGFTNEKIYLFMAGNLKSGEISLDEDEFIEVVKIPLEEAYAMTEKGQIADAKSIIGIQYAYNRLIK